MTTPARHRRPPRRRAATRRAAGAAGAALACIAGAALGGLSGTAGASAVPAPITITVQQAVAYAHAHGVQAAITVLDEHTGSLYEAGNPTAYYGSASVVKLMVATKLIATGQIRHHRVAAEAWSMITRSDDTALQRLLPLVGGTSVIHWVAARYRLADLGTTPRKAWCWGNTQITSRGIAELYRAIQHDRVVGPWLMNAIHHYATVAADGTRQVFGLPVATRGAGIKQGWGHCSSDTNGSVINSTGVLAGGRFAIAILTNTNHGYVNWTSYNPWQAGVVSTMARILLPAGGVTLPGRAPLARLDTATSPRPLTISLAGWAFDPDHPTGKVSLTITSGHTLIGRYTTNSTRADVNRAYHLTGQHGYALTLTTPPGQRSYCVTAHTLGPGTAATSTCAVITIGAAPPPPPPPTQPPSSPPTTSPAPTSPPTVPTTPPPSTPSAPTPPPTPTPPASDTTTSPAGPP